MGKRISGLCILVLILAAGNLPAQKKGDAVVQIETIYGNIRVKLYKETPLHRENFLKLAGSGQYDGTTFHRVISQFMIQGGGLEGGTKDIGVEIPAEIKFPQYYHKRGALAAARTGDDINPERKSSGSQFYIVQGRVFDQNTLQTIAAQRGIGFTSEQAAAYTSIGGAPHLDNSYTVFGEVIDGMDVVDKIAAVKTQYDKPVEDIIIKMKVISR